MLHFSLNWFSEAFSVTLVQLAVFPQKDTLMLKESVTVRHFFNWPGESQGQGENKNQTYLRSQVNMFFLI